MTATLGGCKVLVTRPRAQADSLCRLIRDAGGEAVSFPTLEIAAAPGMDAARLAALLDGATHVIFISRNAVEYFERHAGDVAAALGDRMVLAAGGGTGEELRRRRVDGVRVSPGAGGVGLLSLGELAPARMRGREVLIVRGAGGREYLKDELERRGARVRYATVYRRLKPAADAGPLWRAGGPDIIVVTSAQGLDNLVEMTPPEDRDALLVTPLVVISPRLAAAAARAGFTGRVSEAPAQSDRGILEAIMQSVES